MSEASELRPLAWLRRYSERYPGAWKAAAKMRSDRGKDLPYWPDWCYLPVSVGFALASARGADLGEQARRAGILAALAAWRMTKGIYRYDPDVLDAVWKTPVGEKIPTEVLFSLPEWCCYVETPGKTLPLGATGKPRDLSGFFVHLEHDVLSAAQGVERRELRFVLDLDEPGEGLLYTIPMHLTKPTLAGCLKDTASESVARAGARGEGRLGADEMARFLAAVVPPLLSLTLYLCSVAEMRPEDGEERRPANPEPKRTKKDKAKLFAVDSPTVWEVGHRTGAALRSSGARQPGTEGEVGRTVRGRLRRAHWHAFWVGPHSRPEEREIRVKWLPPTTVKLDDSDEAHAIVGEVD